MGRISYFIIYLFDYKIQIYAESTFNRKSKMQHIACRLDANYMEVKHYCINLLFHVTVIEWFCKYESKTFCSDAQNHIENKNEAFVNFVLCTIMNIQ